MSGATTVMCALHARRAASAGARAAWKRTPALSLRTAGSRGVLCSPVAVSASRSLAPCSAWRAFSSAAASDAIPPQQKERCSGSGRSHGAPLSRHPRPSCLAAIKAPVSAISDTGALLGRVASRRGISTTTSAPQSHSHSHACAEPVVADTTPPATPAVTPTPAVQQSQKQVRFLEIVSWAGLVPYFKSQTTRDIARR